MTDATLLPFELPSVRRKKLTIDFDGGNQSSDGGLLLLRHAERKLGVCGRLANAMPDRRDASRIRHEMFEMVMARVSAAHFGLAHRPSTMALQSAAAGHGIPRLRNVLMALSVGAFGQ